MQTSEIDKRTELRRNVRERETLLHSWGKRWARRVIGLLRLPVILSGVFHVHTIDDSISRVRAWNEKFTTTERQREILAGGRE